VIRPCWSSSAAQLAYTEIQVELEPIKAAACHWTEHDLMIPLALSARNCQKTAEEKTPIYVGMGLPWPLFLSHPFDPPFLLPIRRFSLHDCG
jgi:hypothetical protein